MSGNCRVDLLVIGGGINGLGLAARAAARGISVLLVEKSDFGGGTTAASSRLIHGGLRYLQYGEIGLVQESLRERGILVRERPHLVRPLRLGIPTYRGGAPSRWKLAAGLGLYALLARDPAFPYRASLSLSQMREREPGLRVEGLTGGFLYPDAQIEFPERLCVELYREIREAGGEAWNHTQVVRLVQHGSRVSGAELRDVLTGERCDVEAAVVVNAAGPWVDAVNALLPQPPAPLIGGTSGVHLVLPLRPGGPQGALYTAAPEDGRPFFLLPWDGRLLVGTTDVRFTGHPDGAVVRERDVAYLLNATNALFPGASYMPEEIRWTTVGVRPLPISGKGAAAVTRRHFLVDHERREGIPGLASLVGGKLTTYRSLAEKAVQWVERALGRPPGPSGRTSPPARLSQEHSASGRLARLYGNRADAILKLARKEPAYGVPLAPDCPAALAEAIHAVDQEGARTAEDVILRRLVLLPPRPEWLAAAETVVQDRSGAGRPASGGR